MAKKKVQTLMTVALEKTAPVVVLSEDPPLSVTLPVTHGAPTEAWYKTALRPFVKDSEQFTFVCEQVEGALAWGGDNHMVKFPQDALIALLQRVRDDHIVKSTTPAG